jgi:hypothetical protein
MPKELRGFGDGANEEAVGTIPGPPLPPASEPIVLRETQERTGFLISAWIEFGLHFGVSWVFAPLKKSSTARFGR